MRVVYVKNPRLMIQGGFLCFYHFWFSCSGSTHFSAKYSCKMRCRKRQEPPPVDVGLVFVAEVQRT